MNAQYAARTNLAPRLALYGLRIEDVFTTWRTSPQTSLDVQREMPVNEAVAAFVAAVVLARQAEAQGKSAKPFLRDEHAARLVDFPAPLSPRIAAFLTV